MSKMTRAEVGEVIEQIKHLIITANKDHAIVKSIAAQKQIRPAQARQYVARAHKDLAEQALPNLEEARTKAIERYELIIKECIKSKQYKTAAMTQEKIDKLLGTQAAIKMDIDTTLSGKKDGEPIPLNGFLSQIISSRERAEEIKKQVEAERMSRNGG